MNFNPINPSGEPASNPWICPVCTRENINMHPKFA
jgi:hypothetical protein